MAHHLSLIEGTFADVWSAQVTVVYYSVLASSSFIGAGTGKQPHIDACNRQQNSRLVQGPLLADFYLLMEAGDGLNGLF